MTLVPSDFFHDGERVIEAYDNGSLVKIRSYAGGGSRGGAWSRICLCFVAPDGRETTREFAMEGEPLGDFFAHQAEPAPAPTFSLWARPRGGEEPWKIMTHGPWERCKRAASWAPNAELMLVEGMDPPP